MVKTEVSFTSLCYIKEDYDGRKWLQRLADIDNEKLCVPFKSNRSDYLFENRDRLFLDPDGPSEIGKVGIWSWTASPARDNPEIDYVQSYYERDISPVRIVTVPATNSLEDLVEQLKSGAIRTQPHFCDTLFCYQPQWGQWEGVLCRANEFQIIEKKVRIEENIYSLPYYSIHTKDIYNWDDKNFRFLKELQMDNPSGFVSVGNSEEIIRALILERSTWPLFKECIGATKADWRNSKKVLERICDDSLYEAIIQKLKCTPEQAKQDVNDFVERANILIDAGDIDADVLAQIALCHDELRLQCEEIVSKKWREDHAAEIAKAEQQLADIEKAISSAEEKRNELLEEIAAAQSKCDQLLADIKRHEALGKDTVIAVREKISEAQKDMAGFIADLSAFLPQPSATPAHGGVDSRWQYICAAQDMYSNDDIEWAENWNNEFDAISQNLSHSMSIDSEMSTMLTAFLYAAHINNVSLLIAGPGGYDIAEVLSMSLYANSAGQLILGDENDNGVAGKIKDYKEQIVSIQNMFGKGWTDILPQAFNKIKKHIIWSHPYTEDLIIEPQGLYHYMLPVFSECFVGAIPASNPWPGKRTENFEAYISQKKTPLRITAFKQLGLSKLIINQLERVLSDAKAILDNPAKDKDMEMLFGVLPFSVLMGRIDILKETVETESGISNSVKMEASRYIKEE